MAFILFVVTVLGVLCGCWLIVKSLFTTPGELEKEFQALCKDSEKETQRLERANRKETHKALEHIEREKIVNARIIKKMRRKIIRELLEKDPSYILESIDEQELKEYLKHLKRKGLSEAKAKKIQAYIDKGENIPPDLLAQIGV